MHRFSWKRKLNKKIPKLNSKIKIKIKLSIVHGNGAKNLLQAQAYAWPEVINIDPEGPGVKIKVFVLEIISSINK